MAIRAGINGFGRMGRLGVRASWEREENASLTDFVFEATRPVTAEEVNGYFKEAAEGELAGALGYGERPLVSVDYLDDPHPSIVDALSTKATDKTQIKIYAWYDNEWGYVCRMMDISDKIAGAM